MSQDRDQIAAHTVEPTPTVTADVAPGRGVTSSQLTAPATPIVSALLQRKRDVNATVSTPPPPEDSEDIQIQRKDDGNGVSPGAEQAVAAASSSSGAALPEPVREKFESSLGADLSAVRVHTGAESAEAASAVGARAYTLGNDIHFNAGQYDPGSHEGQHLLAHEVAHTVQQSGGSPQRQNKLEVSSAGDHLEGEADRAADAMVQGAAASVTMGSGVQRKVMRKELSEDQKKTWNDKNGDGIVSRLKAAIDKWKQFRASPASYQTLKEITSGGAASELSELVRLGGNDFGIYAKEKIGSGLPMLSEMAAFIADFRLLIGVIPGVALQEPRHEYTIKKDETSFWNNVPFIPITSIVIEYKNAFGWNWKREFSGGQLQWKVGFDYDKEGVKGGGVAGGGPNPKTGAPSKNAIPSVVPMPAMISVNVGCKATPTAFGYWGFENLGGVTLTADGPQLKGSYNGFGVKKGTGGIITLVGNGGPIGTLDFMNLESTASVMPKLDAPDSPLDSHKPQKDGKIKPKGGVISLQLVAGGAGAIVPTGKAEVAPPPELKPRPVLDEQQWKYFIYGFETGSPEAPIPIPEINPIARMAKEDVDKKKAEFDTIQDYLKEAGIEEKFKVSVFCEGFASRRWKGAGNNDSVRQQKNQELSQRRAENVLEDFRSVLGVEHDYHATGKGASIALPRTNQPGVDVHPEVEGDLVEQELRKIAKTYEDNGESPEEAKKKAEMERKRIEQQLGRESDQAEARRVNVLVVWRGHRIEWAPGL